LYVYQAGTSTPVVAYRNAGLTAGQEHPNPIPTDSYGIVPAFWLADGDYRARLVSSDGAVIFFDVDNIPASGASGGGGGGDTTDPNSIFATGDIMWQPVGGTRAGWVRDNARTIGSATSGANERANADCENLFLFYWNTYTDAFCPVTGGRGASAAADWTANKKIATLDMRGRGPSGLDGMGNSAAGRITATYFGPNTDVAPNAGGADNIQIIRQYLPNQSLDTQLNSGTVTVTDGGHAHPGGDLFDAESHVGPFGNAAGATTTFVTAVNNSGSGNTASVTTGITAALANLTGFTSTLSGGVSQIPHTLIQPTVLGTWFRKL
jgi:hypothetical protein